MTENRKYIVLYVDYDYTAIDSVWDERWQAEDRAASLNKTLDANKWWDVDEIAYNCPGNQHQ